MPDLSLALSIAHTLYAQVNRTSDRIIRIESSRDWPVPDAMRRYREMGVDLRLFIRRPFKTSTFSPIKSTDNASTATAWRNERKRAYDIVIIGATGGPLDSGLKDVRRVDRRTLISNWKLTTLEQLPPVPSELSKPEVKKLLDELFEFVANGSTQASSLEEYIRRIVKVPTVTNICESLWLLGLSPDPRAIDIGMAKRRLAKNRDIVTQLATTDDSRIDRMLEMAVGSTDTEKASTATAAIAFRDSRDPRKLKTVRLTALEEILENQASTPSTRVAGLIELLNHFQSHDDEVTQTLAALSAKWDTTAVQEAIEAPFKYSDTQVTIRLNLTPSKRNVDAGSVGGDTVVLDYPWTSLPDGMPILASTSLSPTREPLTLSQRLLTGDGLVAMGYALSEVNEFLEARRALGKYEPWLDADSLPLFLLVPDALAAAEHYLRSWENLAKAAVEERDARPFIEALQVLETVSGPGDNPDWILLGPFHPYRLDPTTRAVRQCLGHLAPPCSVAQVGSALEWTLDKSFPAYPTLHRREKTLYAASTTTGVLYATTVDANLPSVRESGGLDRITNAIDHFSPWLRDGITVLVIDPPPGGGVSKALEALQKREGGRPVTVYHLATHDNTDPLDAFDGKVNYLQKVPCLSAAVELPQVNILIRFAPASAGAGEPYTSDWRATRGTHLALRIDESFDGPFATRPTTKIKIDPRLGNMVVRMMHRLYEALTGGRPIHATLRPLVETDDAPTLSRMASNTDWVVFAAPGPLGLVAPRTINSTLRYVGRSSMGCYGLYAYVADEMFPVRRHFEAHFQKTPMAAVSPARMVDLLVDKAQESSDAVLFSSLSRVPAHIGSLVSLHIAKQILDPDSIAFALNLDEFGWTSVWLGEGVRADFLVISIDANEDVVFQVVESKSAESGHKVECSPAVEPFVEAIKQVTRTLNVLEQIATAVEPTLDEDLRYTSLIEQLMAAAMARSTDLGDVKRKRAIRVINNLSQREAKIVFKGLVVLTQPGINAPRETRNTGERLTIAWAGNPDVEQTFGLTAGSVMTAQGDGRSPSVLASQVESKASRTGTTAAVTAEGLLGTGTTSCSLAESSEPNIEAVVSQTPVVAISRIGDMVRNFINAARIHGVPVSDPEPVYLQAGPSVVVAGIRLREGAKVRELQARLQDIARDAGFGDVSNSIFVENDNEPRTVRVIMPRPDREFPRLPTATPSPLTATEDYLPFLIGQTIDGRDFETSLESWPHMLIAGTSGSGKTTFVKSILRQAALHGPGRLKTLIVDGKGETDYFGIVPNDMFPTQFPEIQLGPESAINVLRWTVQEMEERREQIVSIARRTPSPQPLKATDLFRRAIHEKRIPEVVPLLVVIDEFSEIMLGNRPDAEEFESLVQRVAQMGRSRLVHVILATQRPDRETVRGAIKANLGCRAVFRLPTQADSVTVLGHSGAENLLSHGDMLFRSGTAAATRIQGYRD